MATFTLYEYQRVTSAGEPVVPPIRRTALAFDAAVQLAKGTLYFEVIPSADARFRVSDSGAAADTNDAVIYADVGDGRPVDPSARPYLYLTAA